MLLYVVVYDIPCDKRRRKVADLLEGYGTRVQYSVFECQLTQPQYDQLRSRLKKKVKLSEDSIRFYPLTKHTLGKIEAWGGLPLTNPPTSIII